MSVRVHARCLIRVLCPLSVTIACAMFVGNTVVNGASPQSHQEHRMTLLEAEIVKLDARQRIVEDHILERLVRLQETVDRWGKNLQ